MNHKSLAMMTASLLIGSFTYTTPSFGFNFSLDPSSSSIDGVITPDDILEPGLNIVVSGTDLGLQDDFFGGVFDSLNALSYGGDPITRSLAFTVDKTSTGLPETAVNKQALIGQQSSSIFRGDPSFSGTNKLLGDAPSLGLTPGLFGDGLNSLSSNFGGGNIYFSIDFFSATNGFGTNGLSSDILISSGNGTFNIFADNSAMGLTADDDIDALMLLDRGTKGILDPGIDQAVFSLSSFSPNTLTFTGNPYEFGVPGSLSPADLLFTDFMGSFSGFVSASAQGLIEGDDSVTGITPVPEPSLFLGLLTLGSWGLANLGLQKRKE
ncbi:hypothetical protein [Crocosphaera sp. XPORK-15E]|uniref:hypothetical protein n=1 Tax=Crocosphaera sp. XPORK-15E TaxID=3110247 RepID=UPI002B215DCF|nr:hypothetical protein [Crocosphaera sp. XPORK-15E]MEA5536935.1 hypothetical protein [Crocosphaera sp. XPORK-15E]